MKTKTLITAVLFPFLLLLIRCGGKNDEYLFYKGEVFGTYYSITYLHPDKKDLYKQIERKFKDFDNSLSTFNPNSIISRINENDPTVTTDTFFESMYTMAVSVSEQSNGAFDITVAPLVNAWGFGFGNNDRSVEPYLDTIMPYIGYKKIRLEQHRLVKQHHRTMLDVSAIAKGQSCNVIAQMLEENGCTDYMVEIGGEITCKGLNPKGQKWHIGIDKPIDDPANEDPELQVILAITDAGLATSGNYRQFYIRNGRKYAHTIDPRSGYPVQHNMLSATVIAPDCMQADAYATAFLVLGVDSSLQICSIFPNMECYLIFVDEYGNNKVTYSGGFKKYFADDNAE